jgi:hypothetical protein
VALVTNEVRYPDGRVGLAETAEIADSKYANGDLAPLPIERRTWGTYNYAALWIGMSHNIPTYLLASGLIAVGMNWLQALITIALANLIVLGPMLLNSHADTKYGIPYPVFARASFGLRGANLPARVVAEHGGDLSGSSPGRRSAAAASPRPRTSSPRSRPSSTGGTTAAIPSPGPRPPTSYSRAAAPVKEHRSHDIRNFTARR